MTRAISAVALSALMAGTSLMWAQTAQAEDAETQNIDVSGNWGFMAEYGPYCSISGEALLISTDDPKKYDCELTAHQVCDEEEVYRVRQSCSATRNNDQLLIQSKVEEFLHGEPTTGYRPDNFSLTILSNDFMKGALHSYGLFKAEFRRSESFTS
ncbi:MAG: hypothetical protein CMK07_08620 [Ponticaulis sp.]|nr:hypothetical protein [Ponticaulis sp.]